MSPRLRPALGEALDGKLESLRRATETLPSAKARMLRGTVMSKFELQKRFTADSLLKLLGKEGPLAGQALLDRGVG